MEGFWNRREIGEEVPWKKKVPKATERALAPMTASKQTCLDQGRPADPSPTTQRANQALQKSEALDRHVWGLRLRLLWGRKACVARTARLAVALGRHQAGFPPWSAVSLSPDHSDEVGNISPVGPSRLKREAAVISLQSSGLGGRNSDRVTRQWTSCTQIRNLTLVL